MLPAISPFATCWSSSDECSEDFIEVYDGTSTVHTLLGRWCGQDGTHLISSGSSLLLIFQTGPGGPPWDYSGFDITYYSRWKCEFTFQSHNPHWRNKLRDSYFRSRWAWGRRESSGDGVWLGLWAVKVWTDSWSWVRVPYSWPPTSRG